MNATNKTLELRASMTLGGLDVVDTPTGWDRGQFQAEATGRVLLEPEEEQVDQDVEYLLDLFDARVCTAAIVVLSERAAARWHDRLGASAVALLNDGRSAFLIAPTVVPHFRAMFKGLGTVVPLKGGRTFITRVAV